MGWLQDNRFGGVMPRWAFPRQRHGLSARERMRGRAAVTETFRLTMAQLNPVVGDIDGNAAKARAAWDEGRAAGADMVMLPEMFLVGYQAQDLIMKPVFEEASMAALRQLAADCADGPMLGIGGPLREVAGGQEKLRNAESAQRGVWMEEVKIFKNTSLEGTSLIHRVT